MNWLHRIAKLDDLINPPGQYPGVGDEKGEPVQNGITVYPDQYGSKRYVLYVNGEAVSGMQVVVSRGNALIANIFTREDSRRLGFGKQVYQRILQDYPNVQMSRDLSADGQAFVKSVGALVRH